MANKLLFPMIREFNNIPYYNSLLYDMKKECPEDIIAVLSPNKYIGLFTYADEIIVRRNSVYDATRSDDIERNKLDFLTNYLGEIECIKNFTPEYQHILSPDKFKYFDYHIGDDWYYTIFSNTARMLIEQGMNHKWSVPNKERYDYYKSKRPYVVVNGRWIFKDNKTELYNNRYEALIEFLISRGITVINTTHNKPNLSYDPALYSEPDCTNYLEQLAIFLNANMVYSTFSAGGINQHLLCKANFCLVSEHPASWVHNGLEYGYNKISVVDARRQIHDIITETVLFSDVGAYERIIELSKKEPPQIDKFFNNDKVRLI